MRIFQNLLPKLKRTHGHLVYVKEGIQICYLDMLLVQVVVSMELQLLVLEDGRKKKNKR